MTSRPFPYVIRHRLRWARSEDTTALAGMALEPEWSTRRARCWIASAWRRGLGVSFGGYSSCARPPCWPMIAFDMMYRLLDWPCRTSSSAPPSRRTRSSEPEAAWLIDAAHRAEVQCGPGVEATAGQTPHGPEHTERVLRAFGDYVKPLRA